MRTNKVLLKTPNLTRFFAIYFIFVRVCLYKQIGSGNCVSFGMRMASYLVDMGYCVLSTYFTNLDHFTWTLWSKLLTIRITRPALGLRTFGAVDVTSASKTDLSNTDVTFRAADLLPQPKWKHIRCYSNTSILIDRTDLDRTLITWRCIPHAVLFTVTCWLELQNKPKLKFMF